MFDRIAPRYDLLNRLLSIGQDQRWRRSAATALALPRDARVLDLATGTGDVAILVAQLHPDATGLGLDPSDGMRAIGTEKIQQAGLSDRIELREGDAQALALESSAFDGVTMAFGIRNVANRTTALREIHRVLKPGRRAAILELNEPRRGLAGAPARFHVRRLVPAIGAALGGREEYRYLQSSVLAFPPAGRFVRDIEEAGLVMIETRPMTFGAVTLFVAEKR